MDSGFNVGVVFSGLFLVAIGVMIYALVKNRKQKKIGGGKNKNLSLLTYGSLAVAVVMFILIGAFPTGASVPQAEYDAIVEQQAQAQEQAASLADVLEEQNEKIAELESQLLEANTAIQQLEIKLDEQEKAAAEWEQAHQELEQEYEKLAAQEAVPAAAERADAVQSAAVQAAQETPVSAMVWIPNSGKRYHSHSGCSNMKNPSQVTLDRAQSLGFTPCQKCY